MEYGTSAAKMLDELNLIIVSKSNNNGVHNQSYWGYIGGMEKIGNGKHIKMSIFGEAKTSLVYNFNYENWWCTGLFQPISGNQTVGNQGCTWNVGIDPDFCQRPVDMFLEKNK
jgi:hypothetical protein